MFNWAIIVHLFRKVYRYKGMTYTAMSVLTYS